MDETIGFGLFHEPTLQRCNVVFQCSWPAYRQNTPYFKSLSFRFARGMLFAGFYLVLENYP